MRGMPLHYDGTWLCSQISAPPAPVAPPAGEGARRALREAQMGLVDTVSELVNAYHAYHLPKDFAGRDLDAEKRRWLEAEEGVMDVARTLGAALAALEEIAAVVEKQQFGPSTDELWRCWNAVWRLL